jgi:hypothetical protein
MAEKQSQYNIPAESDRGLTNKQKLEIQELMAAALANWTGITRFRTIESVETTITDFTDAQHNHSGASGGGQLNPNNAFTTPVTVPNGGTGVNTISSGGILKGAGAGAITTVTPQAGTKTCYVATSSGGAVTTQITFTDGILTAGL